MGAQFEGLGRHRGTTIWFFVIWKSKKGNKTRDQIGTLFGSAPIDVPTDTFFSASSQIGKFTDVVVICHISTLFLSISMESRLEHVAS